VGIGAFRLTVMAAALYPATAYYGINGVAALSAVVSVIDFVISMLLVNRIVKISASAFLRLLAPILLNSSIAAIVAKFCYPSLFALNGWFRNPALIALPAAGLIMLAVYGALTWCMDAETRALMRTAVREGWRRVRAWRERRNAA
jgi:hypothetical protein